MIEAKKEHLVLDRAHLEKANLEQASIFDMYATECSKQQKVVDGLKRNLKYLVSNKRTEIRNNAAATKTKLILDEIDCQVNLDKEVQALEGKILDEEEYLSQLKGHIESLRIKRDSVANEFKLVLSKASLLLDNGTVDPELAERMQYDSMDKAMEDSLGK
jgi:hypothetical protein